MEQTRYGKKIFLATILTSGLALAISQAALAQPASPAPDAKAHQYGYAQMDPAMQKAHDKFLNDTVKERKELSEKGAALRMLMNSGTPDTTKASQLAGEVFELRETLRTKAASAGLPPSMGMMGGHDGYMPCQGQGMGRGGYHHRRP